jgi:hypothetical protein
VFSDQARENLVLKDLRVIANDGSAIAKRLSKGDKVQFLLGIFSINLQIASALAKGHDSEENAAFAPTAQRHELDDHPAYRVNYCLQCYALKPSNVSIRGHIRSKHASIFDRYIY